MNGEERDHHATIGALAAVLGPPSCDARGEATFRGTTHGLTILAVCSRGWHRISGSSQGETHVDWRIHGPTFGVLGWSAGVGDPQAEPGGAPEVVIARLLTPEVCGRLAALSTQLRVDEGEARCLSVGLHDPARAAAILELATWVLLRIPAAIAEAGLGPELSASGTLARLPGERARSADARNWTLLAVAAAASFVVLPIVVVVLVYLLAR